MLQNVLLKISYRFNFTKKTSKRRNDIKMFLQLGSYFLFIAFVRICNINLRRDICKNILRKSQKKSEIVCLQEKRTGACFERRRWTAAVFIYLLEFGTSPEPCDVETENGESWNFYSSCDRVLPCVLHACVCTLVREASSYAQSLADKVV